MDENFAFGAQQWQATDPRGWKLIEIDGGRAFSCFEKNPGQIPPGMNERAEWEGIIFGPLVERTDSGDRLIDGDVSTTTLGDPCEKT